MSDLGARLRQKKPGRVGGRLVALAVNCPAGKARWAGGWAERELRSGSRGPSRAPVVCAKSPVPTRAAGD
ncbi:hypothetical protein [Streptomyces sp. RPT161]|uniref:hypothetical protein n=1 Tax=Streptomyces sp. RPT161 TaxID=3015993 RepID=UPI0022B87274|nr:hypothetical protein [Streptomyces sp. RPT161]